MQESVANDEQIGFGNSELPVEDFDELALDPPNVTLAEGAGDHHPMNVFQGRVVGVLCGDDVSAEENAVKCPLFGLNGEIRLGALDVDESDKDVRDRHLSSLEYRRHELGELGVLVGAGGRSSARRGGWDTESKVDDVDCRLNELFN
jgi:hypothetical protein